ncbi:MAG: SDR family NAD(P)-dependent oxidoreductase [Desulfobacterales bacterium]|nr:SDR family NAD(P)-dependent oxidoreductase [Desulfobacterales bacterium]
MYPILSLPEPLDLAQYSHLFFRHDFYKKFNDIGINYGEYFKGVQEHWANDKEALSLIKIPSLCEQELKLYAIHPTITDSAMQTILGITLFNNTTNDELIIPFSFSEIEVLKKLDPLCYAYAKAIDDRRFDVLIIDSKGQICINIKEAKLKGKPDPMHDFFYIPVWIPVSYSSNFVPEKTKVLIVYQIDNSNIAKNIASVYPDANVFDLKLETTAINDYIKKLNKIDIIYFIGGIQTEHNQEMGILSFFRLIKALIENDKFNPPLQIKVITNNVYQILPDDKIIPFSGGLSGLCRVIRLEYPEIITTCFDINFSDIANNIKLFNPDRTDLEEIAIRDSKCYVRIIDPIKLPAVKNIPLKEGGVYVILGGTGGIGFTFAQFLAENFKARVVLLGRKEFSKELKENFLYIKTDVRDPLSIKDAIKKAKEHFGHINGVIHSAVVLNDRAIRNMDEDTFVSALEPKVQGSINLYNALEGEDIDFMLFFSSAQSFIVNKGQCNYAAACTFKDAFANYIGQKEKYPVKIINWGYWGSVGVASNDSYNKRLSNQGVFSIEPRYGIEAICRIIGNNVKQVMPIKASKELLKKVVLRFNIEQSQSFTINTKDKLEDYLKTVFAEVLKIQKNRIESDATFENYGVDSLLTLEINKRLEKDFGKLPATLLFENMTIGNLVKFFMSEYKDKTNKMFKSEEAKILPAYKYNEQYKDTDIAIIGMSGRYPLSKNLEEFWENLKNGKSCITKVPLDRWDAEKYYGKETGIYTKWGGFIDDVDKFDPLFFNISPREAKTIDPQERLFLECAWSAIEDAALNKKDFAKINNEVGVFVGVMNCNYEWLSGEAYGKGNPTLSHIAYWSIANRVSYFFNFQGPSIAVDTACSSSLSAIHMACESIKSGECKAAIAGGVNLVLHPIHYMRLCSINMLSKEDKCKSFGENADGFVDGEGVGAVILKPLKDAVLDKDHIYGVIKGSFVNSGGKTSGFTVPNPNAQTNLISAVLKRSKINSETISYVEAHGTGTDLGDPIEISGLTKAYKEYTEKKEYCAIGSVKSNVGHLESAAGIAGITKLLLQMKHKKLVPSLNSEKINPNINFDNTPFYIQRTLSDWIRPVINGNEYPRRAGISSFGAGGANAHVIIEEYEDNLFSNVVADKCLIILSAKNKERLKDLAKQMLKLNNTYNLSDVAYTLQVGREHMESRLAIVASSIEELKEKLTIYINGEEILGNDLDETAKAWTYGSNIDWSLLYSDNNLPKRISLPTYPFAKDRYWIPDLPSDSLIGNIDLSLSLDRGLVFKKVLTINDLIVSDHTVLNQQILPGACYVEMAYQAALKIKQKGRFKISNITWLNPLVVDENKEVKIFIKQDKENISFNVESSNIVHAKGSIHIENVEQPKDNVSIEDIKHRCAIELSKDELYNTYMQIGINYGNYFRCVSKVWGNDKEALSLIVLTPLYERELNIYTVHPAILDSAMQTIAGIKMSGSYNLPKIPFWLEEVEVLNPLKPKCYAHVKSMRKDRFNIEILDEAGIVCIRIKELAVKEIKDALADIFYRPVWIQKNQVSDAVTHKRVLIISPEDMSVLDKIIEGFYNNSEIFNLKIDETLDDNILKIGKVDLIWFLGGVQENDLADYTQVEENGVMTLFRLIKSLERNNLLDLEIKVITNSVSKILPDEKLKPFASAILGFVKVVGKEYRNLSLSLIDINLDEIIKNPDNFVPVFKESGQKNQIEEKGFRNKKLYVKTIEQIMLPPVDKTPFKHEGVYMILGGAGGIGLEFSKYLSRFFKASIILIGRRELSLNQKEKIKNIEGYGGHVLYIRADITDEKSMTNAINIAKSKFGKINGAVHSAIVLKDRALFNMDEENFREVMYPKVKGSIILNRVLEDEPLDFMLFFSSAQSFFANAGQSNYAAASTFKDAYANYLSETKPYPVKLINWGFWGSIGIVSDETYNKRLGIQGVKSIEPHEGMEAIRRISEHPVTQIIVFKSSNKLFTNSGEGFIKLNKLCHNWLFDTFKKIDTNQIIPAYFRLYEALLDILKNNEDTKEDITAQKELIIKKFPDLTPYVNLLDACLPKYPEILTGKIAAIDIIFPNSSPHLVEGIYKGNLSASIFNNIVAQSVKSIIENRKDELINILEVGAGTGGTSASVLKEIDLYSSRLKYSYTDISQRFIQYGKKEYGMQFPFMEFKVFNVESDYQKQGLELASFDIVIAANVLHATRNIRKTLKNIKKLLTPNGVLILNEATKLFDFTTLTFGLLEGWWLFEDEEIRIKGSPLLSSEMWKNVLEGQGFKNISILNDKDSAQHVIISENIGDIGKVETHGRASLQYIEEKIIECVKAALDITQGGIIDVYRQFSEYGVDSIMGIELINRINETFGTKLKTITLFDYTNIKDLSNYIATQINQAEIKEEVIESETDNLLSLLKKLSKKEVSASEVYELMDGYL